MLKKDGIIKHSFSYDENKDYGNFEDRVKSLITLNKYDESKKLKDLETIANKFKHDKKSIKSKEIGR